MKNGEEDSNVLSVELEGENNPTDINNIDTNQNENPNQNNVEQPKPVNIPYYIKVNNQANVVTVYKKDSKRKIHSSI